MLILEDWIFKMLTVTILAQDFEHLLEMNKETNNGNVPERDTDKEALPEGKTPHAHVPDEKIIWADLFSGDDCLPSRLRLLLRLAVGLGLAPPNRTGPLDFTILSTGFSTK